MLFLRHNKLQPPFHDYTTLTVVQLDDLASGHVSPDISPLPERLPFGETTQQKLMEAAFFVCSSSKRTEQTCRAICERLSINPDIRIDPRIDEISFTPSILMKDPDENPLHAVRQGLYAAILSGQPGGENKKKLESRISDFIGGYAGKNAVFFSHGFLIRLLKGYNSCNNINQALAFAQDIPHIDYLAAHDINISL